MISKGGRIGNKGARFGVLALLLLPLTHRTQGPEPYIQELPGTPLVIPMALIPEGTFTMGSPGGEVGRKKDEGPQRQMAMAPFWMSKHEITWDLYKLFLQRSIDHAELPGEKEVRLQVDAIASATVPYVDMSLGMGSGEGLPVGNVTFKAAQQFCKWLSAKTGHFYRLPTEAEWEYAARGGSQDPYFFGGDPRELENYAWYGGNSGDTYHKVGEKLPNPFGLYDILGNVAEWTMDQYDAEGYPKGNTDFVPVAREYPISVRGGSFKDSPQGLRSANRMGSDPVWKVRDPQFPRSKWWFTDAGFVGFRIVRPVEVPTPDQYEIYWGRETQ